MKNFPNDSFIDLQIQRKLKFLDITIFVVKNTIGLGLNEELLYSLKSNLEKLLSRNFDSRIVTLKFSVVENSDSNPIVLCKFISQQLQKRVPFRRAMRSAILKAQALDIKGIKIQISGRLNGAEIARTEWVREGKIPLQNLYADLDYCNYHSLVLFFLSFLI